MAQPYFYNRDFVTDLLSSWAADGRSNRMICGLPSTSQRAVYTCTDTHLYLHVRHVHMHSFVYITPTSPQQNINRWFHHVAAYLMTIDINRYQDISHHCTLWSCQIGHPVYSGLKIKIIKKLQLIFSDSFECFRMQF